MKMWVVAAMSLDGKIAIGADQNSLEWTSREDTAFFVKKTKEAGVVIMGRKTFDTIGKPLKGRRVIVMTRQKGLTYPDDGVEYRTDTVPELVRSLELEDVEQVVIAGGATVYSEFFEQGMVTDVFVTIEPIIFGKGVSFVDFPYAPQRMKLVDSEQLNEEGAMMLHYQV